MNGLNQATTFMRSRGWLLDTPAHFVDSILSEGRMVEFGRGDIAIGPGEPVPGLLGVVSGALALLRDDPGPSGNKCRSVCLPGEWIGEPAMFGISEDHAVVVATRATVCLEISGNAIEALCVRQPETWRWLGLLCAQHLHACLDFLEDMRSRRPAARIAAVMLQLANIRWPTDGDDEAHDLDLTQETLSMLASVSRASLSIYLKEFEEAQLIRRAYGRLRILDPAGLRKVAADA